MRGFLGLNLACALLIAMPAAAQTPKLSEGQVWTFKDAPAAESRVVIRKLEKVEGEDVVHVSVHGVPFVRTANGLVGGVIAHEPFALNALLASIDELTTEPAPADPLFAQGYQQWRDARGGWYTISIAQSIEAMRQTIQQGRAR